VRRIALILAALVALAGAVPAASLAAAPRASFNDIEDEVMCVTCGVPLPIAESPQADQERALIRRLIDRGLTKAQIEDALVAEYGDRVLATPKDSGFGLAAWLVPIIAILAALGGIAYALPRWKRARAGKGEPPAAGAAPAQAADLDPDDAARLDADLARYEV
jgi:cytochrome c-type biogenesis protein CcmH/NrfF